MSGFEVMGLISATISCIDASAQLYTAIQNTSHLPGAFKDAAQRLPLVKDTLVTIETRLNKTGLDKIANESISIVIKGCKEKAERLADILEQVAAQSEATRIEKYRLAVRRLGKENTVEVLMTGLLEDVHLLAAHDAVRAVGDDKMDELMAAIKELSRVPPSAPAGPVFTYQGVGDQMNNTGSGTQNINKGAGQMNSAGTIYVGLSSSLAY
ncbi:SesA protein [Lindgomyces ingoldianus]|uniref:SesA protein n=1 Tax=Lindgomyces ingoldianus TaxID=673940 RepID=A0ACB6RD09_9PLEO|nr:SesA protein [Lindgomyces ingoldianus]KAF2477228.1 SesA protein [Lindgomyces ingoldianus]